MGVSIFNTGYDLQDQIDAAESAIAIVSIGSTHAAITSGQYVYVREHGTLAEGLYKATSNIAANATLSGSNVTAVSGGGLNALNSNLTNKIKRKTVTVTCTADTWQSFSLPSGMSLDNIINIEPTYGSSAWILWRTASSKVWFLRIKTSGTGMYIDDTSGDFDLDIIYTDHIESVT